MDKDSFWIGLLFKIFQIVQFHTHTNKHTHKHFNIILLSLALGVLFFFWFWAIAHSGWRRVSACLCRWCASKSGYKRERASSVHVCMWTKSINETGARVWLHLLLLFQYSVCVCVLWVCYIYLFILFSFVHCLSYECVHTFVYSYMAMRFVSLWLLIQSDSIRCKHLSSCWIFAVKTFNKTSGGNLQQKKRVNFYSGY